MGTTWKNIGFPLVMALSFCALLSTCFIESVFAPGGMSADNSCYAYIDGEVSGGYFTSEFHQGGYFHGGVYHTPYTIFQGDGPEPYYYYVSLQYKMFAYKYKYNTVDVIYTFTDSGFSSGTEDCVLWVGFAVP